MLARSRLAVSVVLVVALIACPVAAGPMGAGTQERDWIDGEPGAALSLERHVVRVEDDLRIPVRDGVELHARLFRPSLPDGPGACVLVANGYGAQSAVGALFDPGLFEVAAHGYAVLHVSLRGSGQSGGSGDLYAHYGRDGHDLVEWMARQPWCNGAVGMMGASLLGISQWLTAREAPPHLRAIAPQVACGDCYGVLWYPGGMLPGPGREARRELPGVENEYASAIAHRDLDAWWRERVTLAADHRAMADRGIAALITGGFQDYISPASLRAYREYGGRDAPKRLIVGPWPHSVGAPFVRELIVEFFDRHLRGRVDPTREPAKVLIHVEGPDRWRRERDWPLPDERRVQLLLGEGPSGSISGVHDGRLSARVPTAAAPVELGYTPQAGPFLPTLLGRPGRPDVDQTPWSRQLPTWTSAALRVPTEVTGDPRLALSVSSSADDADLVVSLTDVAPDGSSRLVSQGYLNLPRALDPARPRPREPGAIARYELELAPVSYVFAAGHRIRLTLAGGAVPAPGQVAPQGPGKHPRAFMLTVYPGADPGSALDLPVIGSAGDSLAAD